MLQNLGAHRLGSTLAGETNTQELLLRGGGQGQTTEKLGALPWSNIGSWSAAVGRGAHLHKNQLDGQTQVH